MYSGKFRNRLLQWYAKNSRKLPWIQESDPYKIWLCEVIMQQTQVAQGLVYYGKFVDAYPTVNDLAAAEEQEVLKMWEGLGYYTRARNLHATARIISREFGGVFPDTYPELLALKGIGPYMAGAILSFAWNKPFCVADANVNRIIARCFGIQKEMGSSDFNREVQRYLRQCFDEKQPAKFNQAMMDFGSLVCKPVAPDCGQCPMSKDCFAYQNNLVEQLPVKNGKKNRRHRYFNYFVFLSGNKTIITQRRDRDIWKSLFQFPLIETGKPVKWEELHHAVRLKFGESTSIDYLQTIEVKPQQLTHQVVHATFFLIATKRLNALKQSNDVIVNMGEIKKYTFPGTIRNFLSNLVNFNPNNITMQNLKL